MVRSYTELYMALSKVKSILVGKATVSEVLLGRQAEDQTTGTVYVSFLKVPLTDRWRPRSS